MKKLLVIAAVALFIAISFSSCKSTERCPAYGEASKHQVDRM